MKSRIILLSLLAVLAAALVSATTAQATIYAETVSGWGPVSLGYSGYPNGFTQFTYSNASATIDDQTALSPASEGNFVLQGTPPSSGESYPTSSVTFNKFNIPLDPLLATGATHAILVVKFHYSGGTDPYGVFYAQTRISSSIPGCSKSSKLHVYGSSNGRSITLRQVLDCSIPFYHSGSGLNAQVKIGAQNKYPSNGGSYYITGQLLHVTLRAQRLTPNPQ